MSDEERGYVVTCPKGHQTAVKFTKQEIRKALSEDNLTLWCSGCGHPRKPSAEERTRLQKWAQS